MPLEEYHWFPKNHLEVLEGHPERNNTNNSLIRRYYYPFIWGVLAVGGTVFAQFAQRKPILSGVHMQVGFIALSALAGEAYGRAKEYYYAENEARLKYYVKSHPEDFPDYPRVKIGDILEPWIPVR